MLAQGGGARQTIGKWLDAHPEAKEFVEEWIKMRRDGRTSWSSQAVVDHLREAYAAPFTCDLTLRKYCQRRWPTLYKEAIARG